jgi:hypothetical protein
MPKDVLIYSYEDNEELENNGKSFSASVFDSEFKKNKHQYLGQSAKYFDILILRDPFNLFASRLEMIRKRGAHGGVVDSDKIVENWIDLARLALEWQEDRSPSKLVILYNKWAKDEGYRREISEALGGKFSDDSVRQVPIYGGGSSFAESGLVKLRLAGILRQFWKVFRPSSYKNLGFYWKRFWLADPRKKVTERWKSYERDPIYQRMFSNPKVVELCSKIFGTIPGTQKFHADESKMVPFGKS